MDALQYIAAANPDQAAALCNSYGLDVQNQDDIVGGLYMIAEQDGTEGLKNIFAIHPDKEVIIENFNPSTGKTTCSGGNCSGCGNLNKILVRTNQASGGASTAMAPAAPVQNNNNLSAMLQTNTLLVIGIVSLITVACFLHKKS